MVSVQIPVGFGQLTVKWRFTGGIRDSVVVIGYDPPTTDPGPHATAIHNIITAAGRPCSAAQMLVGWTYVGLRCTEMTDEGPLSVDFPGLVVGAQAGSPMPPNVSVLIRKTTNAGGRRNRGRLFVPPLFPPESSVDGAGQMTGAALAPLFGLWDGLRTDMGTAGFPWVILHSQAPLTPTPVTGLGVEQLVATQRRRLRK